MKTIPLFDGTRINGIRFEPESDEEGAILRALAANGDEQPSGDRTMMVKAIAIDGRAAYGIVFQCIAPAVKP